MTKKNQNFDIYAGDTKDLVITVTDALGNTPALNGATAKWVLKKTVGGPQIAYKTLGNGITISGNTVTVRISNGDTAGLQGRYYHEAEVTDASGNVSTITTGNVTIEPSGV